jgi:hypothetical protein
MALLSRNLLPFTPEHVSARTLRPEGKGVTVVLESGKVQQMPVCHGRYVMFAQIKRKMILYYVTADVALDAYVVLVLSPILSFT